MSQPGALLVFPVARTCRRWVFGKRLISRYQLKSDKPDIAAKPVTGRESDLRPWASSVRRMAAALVRLAAHQPARLVLCDDRYCSVCFRGCYMRRPAQLQGVASIALGATSV